jgi:hypothetical protein
LTKLNHPFNHIGIVSDESSKRTAELPDVFLLICLIDREVVNINNPMKNLMDD